MHRDGSLFQNRKKFASDLPYHTVFGSETSLISRFIESVYIFSNSQNSRIWMQLRSGCFTASPSGAIFRAGIKLLPSSYTSIVQLLTRKSRETNSSNPSLPILDSQTPRSTITNLPVMQIRKALFNLGISSLTESGEKLNKPALSATSYAVFCLKQQQSSTPPACS